MKMRITILSCTAVFLLIVAGCSATRGVKASPEMKTYEKILEVPGQTKDEIYIKANGWFVETFNSAESVIEFQDKEAGKIMGKYVFNYSGSVSTYNIKQTVDISVKDDKVRVIIKNPIYKQISSMGKSVYDSTYKPLETEDGVQKARAEWSELVTTLEEYLKKDDKW